MSEFTLVTKTKEASTPKAKKQKSEMSYEDALKAINVYDAKLKEAGKHRMFNPPSVTEQATIHVGLKTSFVLSAVAGGEVLAQVNHVLPMGGIGFLTLMGTLAGGIIGIAVTSGNQRFQKFVAPMKVKKLQAEYEISTALQALKEEEFATLEAGILKQAKKPVKVIEKHLAQENRSIIYSGEMGSEGFTIQEVEGMSIWEKELLKAVGSKAKALESSSRKEITA